MAKRLLRTALLCAVLILPLTLTAFADTTTRIFGDYTNGNYYELILDKSDGTVTGGQRRGSFALEIPPEIDGVPVRRIGPEAFQSWWGCQSVTIPDSVTSIGKGAFTHCNSLQSVTLPARLTKIEDELFYVCEELRNVSIPDGVTEIGERAFASCRHLSMPHFPDGLTRIGSYAFNNIGGHYYRPVSAWEETLVLPDSLKILEEGAFNQCYSLTGVTIPGGLTEWRTAAFAECSQLASVVIAEGAKEIPENAFRTCKALQTVSLPDTLVSVGEYAFYNTPSLLSVDIPGGVKTIEAHAFIQSGVTEAFLPKSLTYLGVAAFGNASPFVVYYEGTEAQWNALKKASDAQWRAQFPPEYEYDGYNYFQPYSPLPDDYAPTVHYNAKRTAQASAAVQPETPAPSADVPQPSADIPPEERGPFDDVRKSDYFCEGVVWAVGNGVTAGTTPATFSPQGQCTRAHAITFLWRACGSPDPEGANPYSDVPEGRYYTKAAIWAYERGLTEGGEFNGSNPCTRMMAVAWLWKLAGSPAAGESPFRDVSGVSAQAAAWAAARGVTNGTSETTFHPGGTCTRAQIVTFLYRAYNAGELR